MAAGGERKVLGNGFGDYNQDYQKTVQVELFFLFAHTNISKLK
jgi:hypothetical protein